MDNSREFILDRLKSRSMSIDQFNFEKLTAPPLFSLLTPQDVNQLHYIATSIRYSAKPKEKFKAIDEIMRRRGFAKFVSGTNRVAYRFIEDDRFLIKVAIDDVGIKDNPREFQNQFIFQPFVTKVFEVSPCGTVGVFERVVPITSREEYLSVAEDVYNMINNWFIGEYVLEDIGTKFFMNIGIRKGFGPVILDFPYVYKLDGNKLYCKAPANTPSGCCDGVIDYDAGFNFLYCTKCGVRYRAKELEEAVKDNKVVVKAKGESRMKIVVRSNSKNVEKEVVVGSEYGRMEKKVPSKPIKGREEKLSNTKIKEAAVEEKKIVEEVKPKEVIKPIEFDESLITKENKTSTVKERDIVSLFKEIGQLIESTIVDKVVDDDTMNDIVGSIPESVIKFILNALRLKSGNNIIDVVPGDIYYSEDDKMVAFETRTRIKIGDDVYYKDNEPFVLGVQPDQLKVVLGDAGYNINNIEDIKTTGDKYGECVYYFGKIINVKDIFPEEQPCKVLVLVDDEGNYYTTGEDNNIVAIDTIDDRSVESLSIVSKSWLDGITDQIKEMEEAEANNSEETAEEKSEVVEENNKERTGIPTGVLPPEVSVNGVSVEEE